MKKLKLLVISLLTLTLSGCGYEEKSKTKYEDIIVNKEIRSELNNAASWFFETPMSKKVYYFTLENYGDKEVDKTSYEKYKIGDTYSWWE